MTALPLAFRSRMIWNKASNSFLVRVAEGSSITNNVSVNSTLPCVEGPITATATVPVEEFTVLSIAKSVCPDVVSSCEEVNYTFVLQNAGNVAVVATDNVIVSDTFAPALTNIAVTLNGNPLTEGTDYTYNEATGEFATLPGVITIPAAVISQDAETGVITTTPGTSVLTVTGTV